MKCFSLVNYMLLSLFLAQIAIPHIKMCSVVWCLATTCLLKVLFIFEGSKDSLLTSLAYQAKTWTHSESSGKLSGADLNQVLSQIPSKKVCRRLAKTVNVCQTIGAREILYIIDNQSVSRAVAKFRQLVPNAFPGKL